MKPKILLVADTYYPKVDGTLKFIEEFIKRSRGTFQVSLLVPYLGEKRGERVEYIQPSSWLSLSGYPSMKFSLHNLQTINKAVQKADLVFVQGPALISFLSIYYAHKHNKRVIFYTHVLSWELIAKFLPSSINRLAQKLVKRICLFFYNRCDEVLVPYPELREYLAAAGVKKKMSVARLGVDIDIFSPAENKASCKRKIGISEDKKVVGYVGRISKEKNTHLLLQAFKKLPHQQQVFLLMVGDGPEDQTREFKEIKNCRVTGFVNNVQEYLQAMDVFVMPSLTETTSLATLEAMAAGLPVIATRVGFIQQYIIKNHNGIFFPRRSSTTLAVKIERLLANKPLREKLGLHARKTVAYSFSWERSINKIKKILLVQLSA